ncbi:UDP-N-acetylglucosamine 4,6-dehydratase (inverting) [Candidatus Pelagibacter sp.]|nr:UDP-N-acetylglucosamine 4,6-dehydratase (inverting) [Candidatus Pelagibacter sp.]
MFNNKTILITGGTGSFGKKMIKRLLKDFKPKKIIIYSRDELKQYNLQSELIKFKKQLRFFIGDVRDLPRLKKSLEKVNYVIHAAALKHVPVAEYNPFEAVKTNIIGTQNIVDASLAMGVEKVIALSTDKASSPVNLYGATKLTADKLVVAGNYHKGAAVTKLSVVRYGNVFGSRGSIVPHLLNFKKNEFPVTDVDMTRFSITLNESIQFVLDCFKNMWGGEIFIPKISSYRLIDLVEALTDNIKIKIIGIRPGEKIHEEMISINDSLNTLECKKSYVICPSSQYIDWDIKKYQAKYKAKPCKRNFNYASNKNKFLKISELKNLVKNNIKDFELNN